jgi:hypothetical protein
MSWKREGTELVWTGRQPYRHRVGQRTVLYYPGERLPLERAAALGIGDEKEQKESEEA